MQKFFRFLRELLGPPIKFLLIGSLCILSLLWISTLFGLFVFFAPSPTWLRWAVGIFDSLLLILIICKWISNAYNKTYKPELYENLN
jgi:hypothetical protein